MVIQKALEKKILVFRKDLAKIPELAWSEFKTQSYIISKLGKPLWSNKTALIYQLGDGDESIYFRTEMDALSTTDGVKHVCGHDSHMASLMGAFLYLQKKPLHKKIYFVFQPSEENYPSGAKFIVDNFFKTHKVNSGFGFHSLGSTEKEGTILEAQMASGDYFEITIKGIPTHIKNKNINQNTDPLMVASKIIQKINSRKFKDLIINVGKVIGGESANSIAGEVKLFGDIRANNESLRDRALSYLKTFLKEEEKKYQSINIDLFHSFGYPILKNNQTLLKRIKKILEIKGVVKSFGTEDFSLYPKPYVFLYVSTGRNTSVHQLDFEVPDELTLKTFHYWVKIATEL